MCEVFPRLDCWGKLTPLSVRLVMVLLIAIPYNLFLSSLSLYFLINGGVFSRSTTTKTTTIQPIPGVPDVPQTKAPEPPQKAVLELPSITTRTTEAPTPTTEPIKFREPYHKKMDPVQRSYNEGDEVPEIAGRSAVRRNYYVNTLNRFRNEDLDDSYRKSFDINARFFTDPSYRRSGVRRVVRDTNIQDQRLESEMVDHKILQIDKTTLDKEKDTTRQSSLSNEAMKTFKSFEKSVTLGLSALKMLTSSTNILESTRFKRMKRAARKQYRRRQKKKECVCPSPTPMNPTDCPPVGESDYSFIAALNEVTFVDAPMDDEFRYRCTGVIINKNLFLTSSECVSDSVRAYNFFQVRAGTNSWSSDNASFHVVDKFVFKDENNPNQLTLLKVTPPFPKISSIAFVEISSGDIVMFDSYEGYRWDTSQMLPLNQRKKHVNVQQFQVKSDKCVYCNERNVVCSVERNISCSNYYAPSGIPLFVKNQLIGMQISSFCNQEAQEVERCFTGISEYTGWMETIKSKLV